MGCRRSGYALVKHIRTLSQGDDAVVLMISVRVGFLDKVEAVHCGSDAYFEKPVDWGALLRKIQHLLERTKLQCPRVLSVEDDPDHASYIKAILQSAGYEVRICADAKQFDAELVAFRPDLILMDIELPDFNGHDLARYIRQDDSHAFAPVCFYRPTTST